MSTGIIDSIGDALQNARESRREKKELREQNLRRQELHCHACERYVQFTLDMALDGNHVLECPNCGHEHCRVVRGGVITDDRWDQRNGSLGAVFAVTNTTSTTNSTYITGSSYTNYVLWMDSTSTST